MTLRNGQWTSLVTSSVSITSTLIQIIMSRNNIMINKTQRLSAIVNLKPIQTLKPLRESWAPMTPSPRWTKPWKAPIKTPSQTNTTPMMNTWAKMIRTQPCLTLTLKTSRLQTLQKPDSSSKPRNSTQLHSTTRESPPESARAASKAEACSAQAI